MRYVNCTEAFLAAADNLSEAANGGSTSDDPLSVFDVLDQALIQDRHVRFYVALGSVIPLAMCAAISFNRKVDL